MGGCSSVEESNVGVVEKFGQFARLEPAGCCESVRGNVSLRIQQLSIKVETKTRDNVFVHIHVAVQYQVMKDKVYEAFYRLSEPHAQIQSHISASIRSRAPKIPLDGLFEVKEDLAHDVKKELQESMSGYGYMILDVLITDIDPDPAVKHAMNEINSSERLRVAALAKAEAQKILKVKEAEAEAEARHLAGKGLAMARAEIVKGLEEGIMLFTSNIKGTEPADVMRLILTTQYFDTLKEIGAHSKSNVVYLSHSPTPDLGENIRDGMLSGNAFAGKHKGQ